MSEFLFTNAGYCPCCRRQTEFGAYQDWLRDFYVCSNCGSVPRQRHVQHVLDTRFPEWTDLVVHESSPSHDFLARFARRYSSSQYFDDVARGSYRDGIRSENVEDLTFDDESIDLFITQDVLEHVFHPERAIAEIHRVLKPGGAHVFTTPKYSSLEVSQQRAAMDENNDVVHLLEPAWHGNPIGEKALVTWDYGYDFERLLSMWSGVSVDAIQTVDRELGLDAQHNEVFVIAKPALDRRPTGWRRAEALTNQVRHDLSLTKQRLGTEGPGAVAKAIVGRVKRLT